MSPFLTHFTGGKSIDFEFDLEFDFEFDLEFDFEFDLEFDLEFDFAFERGRLDSFSLDRLRLVVVEFFFCFDFFVFCFDFFEVVVDVLRFLDVLYCLDDFVDFDFFDIFDVFDDILHT